jgi:hypothetical protein
MSDTDNGPERLTLRHLRALDELEQMVKDMARGFETVTGHLVGITGRIAGLEIRMSTMETWSERLSSTMQDGLMWRCVACGERNFNHYENCVSCGRARPAAAGSGVPRHAAVGAGLTFQADPRRGDARLAIGAAEFAELTRGKQ